MKNSTTHLGQSPFIISVGQGALPRSPTKSSHNHNPLKGVHQQTQGLRNEDCALTGLMFLFASFVGRCPTLMM